MRLPILLALALSWTPAPLQKSFNPRFDYTNLRPSDKELWAPLSAARITLEDAARLARGTDENARVAGARFKGGESPSWEIDLWTLDAEQKPARFRVQVSAAEPRETARDAAPIEPGIWEGLSQVQTPIEDAAVVAKERLEKLTDLRAQALRFVPEGKVHWEAEIFGWDADAKPEPLPRRWLFEVSVSEPKVHRRTLQDRFPGEPLRGSEPRQENGLWMHDFVAGDGETLEAESKVKVHYRLWLLDNTKIHDTWKEKAPETFVVGAAPLKGMTVGMQGMRVGGRRKICIPHELAFGEAANELAPARAMIVCDVEVLALVTE
jgi:hypothetical protein